MIAWEVIQSVKNEENNKLINKIIKQKQKEQKKKIKKKDRIQWHFIIVIILSKYNHFTT